MFPTRYFAARFFAERFFASVGAAAEWALVHTMADTTSAWTDTTVVNDTSYQYYVTAVNDVGGESDPSNYTDVLTPTADPPVVDPPDPPPGPPAENNELLSAGHHPFLSVWPPVAEATTTITEGDQAHLAWMFAGVDVQAPPVDISLGATIEDNCTCVDASGTAIDTQDGTASTGAVIETAEPTTADEGSEIEDEEP